MTEYDPSRKSKYPTFGSWDEIIDALAYTHTTSIRDACRLLKSSRTWINRYVLPHMDCIHLSNGYFDGRAININWTKVAQRQLLTKYSIERQLVDKCYISDSLFNRLIYDNMTYSRQTRLIPVEMLLKEEKIREFHDSHRAIEQEIDSISSSLVSTADVRKLASLIRKRDSEYKGYLSDIGKEIVAHGIANPGKRSAAEHVSVTLHVRPALDSLVAPHDIKGYGDTDEQVSKHFFSNGYIRAELKLADKTGQIGKKVFYFKDEADIVYLNSRQSLLIKESEWLKYKDRF